MRSIKFPTILTVQNFDGIFQFCISVGDAFKSAESMTLISWNDNCVPSAGIDPCAECQNEHVDLLPPRSLRAKRPNSPPCSHGHDLYFRLIADLSLCHAQLAIIAVLVLDLDIYRLDMYTINRIICSCIIIIAVRMRPGY
jgi:hypothetical protein